MKCSILNSFKEKRQEVRSISFYFEFCLLLSIIIHSLVLSIQVSFLITCLFMCDTKRSCSSLLLHLKILSIEATVRISGIMGYMLIRSPLLGACAISIVPVVAAINKKYGNWLSENAKAVQDALAQANSSSQEAFSCIRTVIAFASESFENKKYQQKINNHYRLSIKQLYATGFYFMIISTFLVNTIVQALLLFVGMVLISRGVLQVEVLLAFMLYQGQLQVSQQKFIFRTSYYLFLTVIMENSWAC